MSTSRSGAFPPLLGSMQHCDPYAIESLGCTAGGANHLLGIMQHSSPCNNEVEAALQVVGGRFHSVSREGAFQGTRVAILAGFNAASGLQRPNVASSRRLARLQPSGLDLQYAPNMLAQVGLRAAGHGRMSLLKGVQLRHT